MPNSEKIFPVNTIGGRIQSLRHKENLSRVNLYDRVYPERSDYSNSSKDRTVYNWESEKTQLDYQNIIIICRTLKCSSDYLLGLNECTNKTNQFIHEQTGLSDEAIENLLSFSERDDLVSPLDFLLRSIEFQDILATLFSLATYNYDYVAMYIDVALGMIDNSMTTPIPIASTDNLGHISVLSQENAEFRLNRIWGHIMDNISNVAMEKAVENLDPSTDKDTLLNTIKNIKSTHRPPDIPT